MVSSPGDIDPPGFEPVPRFGQGHRQSQHVARIGALAQDHGRQEVLAAQTVSLGDGEDRCHPGRVVGRTRGLGLRVDVRRDDDAGRALTAEPTGVYVAKVPTPAKGWTAFFVELSFPSSKETPDFKFTTEVRVVPDVLPYKFVPKGRPQLAGPGAAGQGG